MLQALAQLLHGTRTGGGWLLFLGLVCQHYPLPAGAMRRCALRHVTNDLFRS